MSATEDADGVRLTAMLSAWQALVIDWDLTTGERRELLPAGGEFEAVIPADTRTRMSVLVEIGYRIGIRDVRERREWLRTPVLLFGLDSPLGVMAGPMEDLLRIRGLVERGFGS